jgi:hypothetical protein
MPPLKPKPDFSRRRHFPGTHGSPFDAVLRVARLIQRIPWPVFAALLLGLAAPVTQARWPLMLGLWAFCLGDWALIATLPRAHKSYGPAKPPTLLLALLRAPFALLPWPLALAAQAAGTALVVYGFWIEPHWVRLTRQALRSPKLNPGAPPLRVLHLGDLHIERLTDRERQVLALARDTAPDLILFSGDFLNLSNVYDPGGCARLSGRAGCAAGRVRRHRQSARRRTGGSAGLAQGFAHPLAA